MSDYETTNIVKLSALKSLAQKTKTALDTKADASALADYALKTDIASAITVKGTVANFAALPANASVGDMYNVTAAGGTDENGVAIKAGDNVVKTATGWDNFGGTIDFSNYVEKVQGKQLSTEDFTTAEKTKLGGISEGAQVNVIESVKVDGSILTVTNKAVDIDLSGKVDKVAGKQLSTEDYTSAEKTKLSGIDESADVNVIETVKVNDTALTVTNKAVNIDLSGKTDKVANATNGNLAALDANGNLTDSGVTFASDTDVNAMLTEVFGS